MADEGKFTKEDIDAAVEKATSKLQESIDRLETKNTELVGDLRKARKAGEIKPEDLTAAEERADKAEKDLADARKLLKTAETDRDKAVKALETESGFTSKLLIQDGLKTALIAAGVKDEDMIDVLSAKFASGATVETEGDARVAKIGGKALAEHIKEWAGSDAGKKFVAAPVNSGGGAGGSQGQQGAAPKTVDRATFDGMSQAERSTFAKEGGKVVDQAA